MSLHIFFTFSSCTRPVFSPHSWAWYFPYFSIFLAVFLYHPGSLGGPGLLLHIFFHLHSISQYDMFGLPGIGVIFKSSFQSFTSIDSLCTNLPNINPSIKHTRYRITTVENILHCTLGRRMVELRKNTLKYSPIDKLCCENIFNIFGHSWTKIDQWVKIGVIVILCTCCVY